jgi:hypothetical protein
VVETIRLESGHTLTGIVGSNPTLSAIPVFRLSQFGIEIATFFLADSRLDENLP